MTSNAVGGMPNNAGGQIQESWSVPETMVDGITERLRKAIVTGAIEACAGRDVTTFRTRSFGTTWKRKRPFGMDSVCFRIAKPRLVTDCSSNHGEGVSSVGAA